MNRVKRKSIVETHPDIAMTCLDPNIGNYSAGAHNRKEWRCEKGHIYPRTIRGRITNDKCKYCDLEGNSLLVKYPEIAKEWHPTKNGDLTPCQIKGGHDKKRWWKCKKNKDHEWEAFVYNRTGRKDSCPDCSKKHASREYNITITHREVAKLWHYEKNGDIKPEAITFGSDREFFWNCLYCDQVIKKITKGFIRSPTCRSCQTFTTEKLYLNFIENIFSNVKPHKSNNEIKGNKFPYEIDILINQKNRVIGIEIDGRFHESKDQQKRDIKKELACIKKGILLIRCITYMSNINRDGFVYYTDRKDNIYKNIIDFSKYVIDTLKSQKIISLEEYSIKIEKLNINAKELLSSKNQYYVRDTPSVRMTSVQNRLWDHKQKLNPKFIRGEWFNLLSDDISTIDSYFDEKYIVFNRSTIKNKCRECEPLVGGG